ncbi:sulfite exporter TauE/SafE family protein [uncultured Cohaesibacter sp.]|uniref:sulfite exporter TauE/SafE family protein n=1 Tax=uncultured Cohaesibacter sp. TaxID=1002546 RepID=UPI0029C83330|nr:sulfite exporter TauE/SafE family protein [uncultured Cohaesibacter sp.]
MASSSFRAFYYTFTTLGYHPDQLMQICVATSTGTIIFTSLRSVMAHHKRGAVSFDLIKSWGLFIAIGSVIGVFAAAALRSHELQLVFGCIGVKSRPLHAARQERLGEFRITCRGGPSVRSTVSASAFFRH